MTTRREIIDDVSVLKKRTKILEEKVEQNAQHIVTHIHATPCGWTDTATTTNTAYTAFYVT